MNQDERNERNRILTRFNEELPLDKLQNLEKMVFRRGNFIKISLFGRLFEYIEKSKHEGIRK